MRIAEIARASLFALLPAAAAFGGLALAPLIGAAGAASFRPSLLLTLRRPPPYLVLLASFAAWMALTALWSPYDNAMQALKFALTLATGLMLARAACVDADARRLTQAAALAAVAVLAVLLAVESFGMPLNHAANPEVAQDWQLLGNPGRGAAVLTCLVWAALGMLAARRAWIALIATLLAAALLASQFGQTANLAAFACGAAAFAVAFLAPRLAIWMTAVALASWLLLAPFIAPLVANAVAPDALPYSWSARLGVWRYVSARVMQHPLFGAGLDASRTVEDTITVQGQVSSAIPLHPHSASLQVWFETGAVGALLLAALIVAGAAALSRHLAHKRAAAAAACGGAAAIGVIANISFGVWQEWWDATMLIAAAAISGLALPAPRDAAT